MDIIWHGNSTYTFKGKNATLLSDPFEKSLKNLKADIVLQSKEGEIAELDGSPKIIDWPGEFEIMNVSIESIPSTTPDQNPINIFVFTLDGLRICNLGPLSNDLTDELLESIGDIDILLVPTGSDKLIDVKHAQTIIEEIDPRLVVIMCFDNSCSEFLKAFGKTTLEVQEKLTIKSKSELPQEKMEFVLLKAV